MVLESLLEWSLLAVTTCLLLMFLVRQTSSEHGKSRSSGAKPLPGPWSIPLLGNMLSLGRSPPHIALTNLSKKFGSIYQIRLGSRPVLVLNGYDAINKALVKKAAIFAGRPQLFSTNLYLSCCPDNYNLSFGSFNERYMLHRKLAESSLRHFTAGTQTKFVESVVTAEAMKLVDRIKSEYTFIREGHKIGASANMSEEQNPGVEQLRNDISLTVANVMCQFLFGERRSYDDREMRGLLHYSRRFSESNKAGNPADFFPWLRFMLKERTSIYLSSVKDLRATILGMASAHQKEYSPGSKQDILDHLITSGRLDGNKEQLERVGLTEDLLLGTAVDFVSAGFETTSATLEWCMFYMAAYPEVRASLETEVSNVVIHNRLPTLDDRSDLPLAQAFILEVLRHSNLVPFLVPHCASEDTVLDGFFIPKDTIVFTNIYSAHMDPVVWSEPDVFNPRRFLAPDGTLDEDKKNQVIPFGVGRRRCPGADLALMEIFLFIIIFIQQFSFENPLQGDLNMEAEEGLLRRLKHLEVRIISRNNEGDST